MKLVKVISRRFNPSWPENKDYEHIVLMTDEGKFFWKPSLPVGVDGSTLVNEVMAYAVNKVVDANVIKRTLEFVFEGKQGTAQEFIEDAVEIHTLVLGLKKDPDFEQMQRIAVFDWMVNNYERWMNVLVDKSGKLWAIDNAACFQSCRLQAAHSVYYLLVRPLSQKNRELVRRFYEERYRIAEMLVGTEVAHLKEVADIFLRKVHILAGTFIDMPCINRLGVKPWKK